MLGTGTYAPSQAVPAAVVGGHRFRSVSAGSFHTCGVADDGYAYCWGANFNGELGNGSEGGHLRPTLVAPPPL